MRPLAAIALLAAVLAMAGCAAPPGARVPEVITGRPVEATASSAATAPPGEEREVVAPHVEERDDEAPQTGSEGDGE